MDATTAEAQEICAEELAELLGPESPLGLKFRGFEVRPQQQDMLRNVTAAYNKGQIALIEAGTGIGKSIAYLLPALYWALVRKERSVISTNTIALQQQLINKDIPVLKKLLGIDVKVVLAKGMGNYVCLRKIDEAVENSGSMTMDEAREIEEIAAWVPKAREGSRTELPMFPSPNVWEQVGAESDACPQRHCPYFDDCFFFKARQQASDAQIVVANHHLLFTDLKVREELNNYNSAAVLPAYKRIVLDEAHHTEDVATEHFADRVSEQKLRRILNRLVAEGSAKHGRLQILLEKVLQCKPNDTTTDAIRSLVNRLSIDLPAHKRTILHLAGESFDAFVQFQLLVATGKTNDSNSAAQTLRLKGEQLKHSFWDEEVVPATEELVQRLRDFAIKVHGILQDLKDLDDDGLMQATAGIRIDIEALTSRLDSIASCLEAFIQAEDNAQEVRWIERKKGSKGEDRQLCLAKLDIAKRLANTLFNRFPSITLCSATLATNKEFSFVRQRLGIVPGLLPERPITENIYEAPFDYQKQALLAVPSDLPDPKHPEYLHQITECLFKVAQACRGNAFFLFTSYSMLSSCYRRLSEKLHNAKMEPMKQGDAPRQKLLQRFRETDRSVLFGTDSFWEGVDVVGDALRCVVIVKLPFQVPTEPLIEARCDWISHEGGVPFRDYTLPHAIVKFKQGFGRLIRNKRDRGCIICLDARLATKPYGRLFVNSLPNCQRMFASTEEVLHRMRDFYRRTHHLTQG